MADFNIGKLSRLIAFLIRETWLTDIKMRNVMEFPLKMAKTGNENQLAVAMKYLENVVDQMQVQPNSVTTKCRRICRGFRDEQLEKILEFALKVCLEAHKDKKDNCLRTSLRLINQILTYDFTAIGNNFRVQEDIHHPLLAPPSWKFLKNTKENDWHNLFFDIALTRIQQSVSTSDIGSLAFQILVVLAHPRKNLVIPRSKLVSNSTPRRKSNIKPVNPFSEK
eukprot:UN28249